MRFLIVDDNPADRDLIVRKLRLAFPEAGFIEAADQIAFESALERADFDFVLSDYQLMWSNGLQVLRRVKERNPEIPVVMFTESGNEEVAVEGFKSGLSDYVRKRYLDRLPDIIQESLEKIHLRREVDQARQQLERSEARYRAISELVSDYAYAFRIDPDGTSHREWITDAFYRITGYTPREIDEGGGWRVVLHPDDRSILEQRHERLMAGEAGTVEFRIVTRGGEVRWLQDFTRPVWDEAQERVVRVFGAARDVTAEKQVAQALRRAHDELEQRVEDRTADLAEANEELEQLVEQVEQHRRQVEQSAREVHMTNRLLRTLIDTLPVGVTIADGSGAILSTNPTGTEILGDVVAGSVHRPRRSYTIHRPDGTPYPPEEVPIVRAVQEGETVRNEELLIRRPNGEERFLLAAAAPVVDEAGRLMSVVTVYQDITARKTAELEREELLARVQEYAHEVSEAHAELQAFTEELKTTSEELRTQNEQLMQARKGLEAERRRYQELFEFAPDGYLVTDHNGIIREANRVAGTLLNVRREFLIGKPLTVYVDDGDRVPFLRRISQWQNGGRLPEGDWELRIQPRGGQPFPASVSVGPARDAAGETQGLRWLLRDVSLRKQAEEEREWLLEQATEQRRRAETYASEMQRANRLLEALVDTMPAGVVVCDAEGAIQRINAFGEQLLGGRMEGTIFEPRRPYTLCDSDGTPLPDEETPLARALEGESTRNAELLVRRADGGELFILTSASPLYGEGDRLGGAIAVFHDITARKRAEAERERLLEQVTAERTLAREMARAVERERSILQTIMENTPAHLAYLDPHFNFVRVNSAYAGGTGYSEQQLVDHNHFDLFPNAENEAVFRQVRETGEPVTFHARPFVYADRPERGTTYWDWSLVPVEGIDGEVQGLVFSLLDVTEREEHLAALNTLIEVSQDVLAETTVEGLLQRVIDAACELTGARVGISGHGYRDGSFDVGATARAEDAPPGPPGERFDVERGGVYMELIEREPTLRLTDEELRAHPAWRELPEGHGPLRGLLGTRLTGRDGQPGGLLMVSDKRGGGDFTREDEALLSQLGALASVGLWHIEARSEAERRAEEMDAVFSAMSEAVAVYDAAGTLLHMNPAVEEYYGLEASLLSAEESGESLDVRDPNGRPVSPADLPLSRALAGERVVGERFTFTNPAGRTFTTMTSAAPLSYDGTGAVVVWHDVTEREQLLADLAAERARLDAVIENSPVGIVVTDDEVRVLRANPAAERLYRRPVPVGQEVESHGQMGLYYPDGSPYVVRDLPLTRSTLDGEVYTDLEMLIRWPDGQERALLVNTAPITGEDGRIGGSVGLLQDITDRKQRQEELQRRNSELEILYRSGQAFNSSLALDEVLAAILGEIGELLEADVASVWLIDPRTEELVCRQAIGPRNQVLNGWRLPAGEGVAGWSVEEGESVIVTDTRDDPRHFKEVDQETGMEMRSLLSVPLRVRERPIGVLQVGSTRPDHFTPGGTVLVESLAATAAIAIENADLFERLESHAEQLEESVARRTAALRASEARFRAIYEESAVGIMLLNRRGRITSANPALEQVLGYPAEKLQGRLFTDFVDPDHAARSARRFREFIEQEDRAYRVEERYVRHDGRSIVANVTLSLVQGGTNRRKFAIGMVEDVTEQRQAQAALVQAEKLTITGKLAASLAHEINNPLQTVIGCLGLTQEALAEGGDTERYLQVALEELRRAAGIVSQLRDLHRQSQPEHRELIDVNELLGRVLTLSKGKCRDRGIELVWEPDQDLPSIPLVPDRIQQVFLNLTLNAIDAMPRGGRLAIETQVLDHPAGVQIAFYDTGVGIDEESLEHLFEPFYSTKPDGLGLGLFITHNIIDEHGGRIEAESELGRGTTFRVWLPAEDGEEG